MKGRGSIYRGYIRHKRLVIMALFAIMAVFSVLSLSAGSAGLSLPEILSALVRPGQSPAGTIVWNIRMPRVIAAIVAGMALSLSGCIMQCMLHNPLASSSTLGVSQGASFGAALAITCIGAGTQMPAYGTYMVSASAFAGGIATTAVILIFSRVCSPGPASMALAGIAISSMFSGATALIQYFADDMEVASIVYWTFGSLGRAGWHEIALIAASCVAAFIFFYLNRWNCNAIASGESTAKSLGVNSDLLVPASLAVCTLITSVAVAFTGCISFIGLIASHIVRRLTGNDHRFLIPGTMLCGASLLLAADILCRVVVSPVVLPIGALTSFAGGPVFLFLIIREGRRG